MKHLIVLPGNSLNNKSWGENILSHYADYFDRLYLQEYEHWLTGDSYIDLVFEEQKLRSYLESLEKDRQVFVLAKSAGSILCFNSVQAGFLNPTHCAFFGIPFEWAVTDVFGGHWATIDTFSVPALAFHNQQDPTAPYEYTKSVIDLRLPKVEMVTTTGSDHLYEDYDVYDEYLLPIYKN